jgi:glycosyltransferase involved in cell wall biosynthesis
LAGRKLILGFSGRVSKEQKRVDRFPELVRCLEQAGIDFRLDIVGDGPERDWLQRKFRRHPRVRIYGKLLGDDYWDVLARWDFAVFVSDYEGLPITMIEAMSLGALPLYPAIGSGGDVYAAKVRSDLLYPPNDFRRLAMTLDDLRHASPDQLSDLRQRARAATAQHLGQAYDSIFSSFIKKIVDLPRISKASFPRRPFFWTDYCPFGVLRRFCADGFFRRNDDNTAGTDQQASPG